jgi:hypothetical protein
MQFEPVSFKTLQMGELIVDADDTLQNLVDTVVKHKDQYGAKTAKGELNLKVCVEVDKKNQKSVNFTTDIQVIPPKKPKLVSVGFISEDNKVYAQTGGTNADNPNQHHFEDADGKPFVEPAKTK